MATLSPSIDTIKKFKVQLTEGEWKILGFLLNSLDDTYEIYVQPFLNGDNPDIILMRKSSGVLIIEVKDYNLDKYYLDNRTCWRLKYNDAVIQSPLKQVEEYKENLFNLHIEELHLRNIQNKNYWATVNCALFFYNEKETRIKNFLLDDYKEIIDSNIFYRYKKFVNYFGLLGNDSLYKEKLNNMLNKFWLNRQSKYFDDTLYESIKRYLKSPFHQLEEGIEINYTKEQIELIRSEIRPRRKIKGLAGSGKTLVLAKRAVNSHIRTKNRVLILTFNHSLKNYIHDKINQVREDFYWDNFYITNYHQFFRTQANNYNVKINKIDDWNDVSFFDRVKEKIDKYDSIFIDEIQDYKQEWIDIISKYFLHDDTEFVVFGDEKQNIYERTLDENNEIVVRQIQGVWNKSLSTTQNRKPSYRMSNYIYLLAMKFQINFFENKYNIEIDNNYVLQFNQSLQLAIDFEQRIIQYFYINSFDAIRIYETIFNILKKNSIHPSNVGILSSKVDKIREVDFHIRKLGHEETKTTFESKEEYEMIKENETAKFSKNGIVHDEFSLNEAINNRLDKIRKIRKNNFWMETGTTKLSTVHSFKGWEIDTLVLLIEEEDNKFSNPEVIYTGITRAKKNLIIINLNNPKYDSFFKKEVDKSFEL